MARTNPTAPIRRLNRRDHYRAGTAGKVDDDAEDTMNKHDACALALQQCLNEGFFRGVSLDALEEGDVTLKPCPTCRDHVLEVALVAGEFIVYNH